MMPDGGDEDDHYARHDEGNANGERKAVTMLGNSHAIALSNLAQKKAETGNYKTESHQRNAGSDPSKKGAFGSHINSRIGGRILRLIHTHGV